MYGFQTVAKLWTNKTEQGRTVGHSKRVQDRKDLPAESAEDMLAIGSSVLVQAVAVLWFLSEALPNPAWTWNWASRILQAMGQEF